MMTAYQLGTLRAGAYTDQDWQTFQDAVLSEHWPDLLGNPDVARPAEVATGLAQLSVEASLPKTIAALKAVSDQRLEQYRSELQWLTEVFASPEEGPTAVMARTDFLTFFKARHMSPEGERIMGHWMKALGQTQSPPSTLRRWFRGMREQAGNPSSAKPTT